MLAALPLSLANMDETLTKLGQYNSPNPTSDFGPDSKAVVYKNHVIVADSNGGPGSEGLRVFDITNKYNPHEDHSLDFSRNPPGFLEPVVIEIVGIHLYVLDRKRGVYKFNLTELFDKSKVTRRRKIDYKKVSITGESQDFMITDKYIIVAAGSGDIYILGHDDFGGKNQLILNYQSFDLGDASSVEVKDDTLFVLDDRNKELQIYDISNLHQYDAHTIREMEATHTYKIDKLLKNPTELTNVMVLKDDHMYLGVNNDHGENKLRILDVSNVDSVRAVSEFETQDSHVSKKFTSGEVHDIKITGKYAYVSSSSGLFLLDVSNPEKPMELSQFYKRGHFETGSFVALDSHGYSFVAADSTMYSFESPVDAEDMAQEEIILPQPQLIAPTPYPPSPEEPTMAEPLEPYVPPSKPAEPPTQPVKKEETQPAPLPEAPIYVMPTPTKKETGVIFGISYFVLFAIIIIVALSAFFIIYELRAKKAHKSP